MPVGRPRKYNDDRVQMQIRISPKVKARLKKESERRIVSSNLLAERAIEEMLQVWEKERVVASNHQ